MHKLQSTFPREPAGAGEMSPYRQMKKLRLGEVISSPGRWTKAVELRLASRHMKGRPSQRLAWAWGACREGKNGNSWVCRTGTKKGKEEEGMVSVPRSSCSRRELRSGKGGDMCRR